MYTADGGIQHELGVAAVPRYPWHQGAALVTQLLDPAGRCLQSSYNFFSFETLNNNKVLIIN